MVDYTKGLFETDEPINLLDGDTDLLSDGQQLRIAGIDTPETAKLHNGIVEEGDYGGREATDALQKLATEGGFTNIRIDGKDKYDRLVGDRFNDKGEFFGDKALYHGLAVPTFFSSESDYSSTIVGRMDRMMRKMNGEQDEWDIAGEQVRKQEALNGLKPKHQAIDEYEYAAVKHHFKDDQFQTNRYFSQSAGFRRGDRTLDNKATNIASTSFEVAKKGFAESAYGAIDWITDIFGYDLSGEGDVERMSYALTQLPVLENQNAFDEQGNWRLESISSFGEWLISNAIISSPYLVTSMLGAVSTPLMTIPALVYTGNTYNEMDEKDPLLAAFSGIGQAALDRLGIEFILPKSKLAKYATTDLYRNAAAREAAIKELMKKGATREEAAKSLSDALRLEAGSFANAAKAGIADKIRAKYFDDTITGAVIKGTAGESITEVLQETIGYLAENNLDFDRMSMQEYQNRALNAAAAGGVLGGVFGGTGQGLTKFSRYSALKGAQESDPSARSRDLKRRDALEAESLNGVKPDLTTDGIVELTNDVEPEQSLDEIAAPERNSRLQRGFIGSVMNAFKERGFKGLFEGNSKNLDGKTQHSKYMTMLWSLLDGNKVYSNGGVEENQHLAQSSLSNNIGTQAEALERFGVKDTQAVSDIMYDEEVQDIYTKIRRMIMLGEANTVKQAYDKIMTDFVKYKNKESIILDYLQRIYDYDSHRARLRGTDIKSVNFYKDKTWNKETIAKNREEFINDIIRELNVDRDTALNFTNNLLDGTENEMLSTHDSDLASLEDIMSIASGEKNNAISMQSIMDNKELGKYFNGDMFYNVAGISGTTASAWANHKYIGSNGHRLAYLIEQAVKAGEISKEEGSFYAQEVKDIIDIRKGKYKQIENSFARAVMQNAIMFSSLAQLPLASVSAMVEVAQTAYNVPASIIMKQIPRMVKSFLGETFNYMNEGASKASRGLIKRNDYIDYTTDPEKKSDRQLLAEYGFLIESQAAAQKHDVKIGNAQQKIMNGFFKLIGLQGITNFTRTMRLATATDTIYGLLTDVMMDRGKRSIQGQQSRELLMQLGMNVDEMIKHLNNDQMDFQYAQDQMRLATFNFVNEAVAHPTKTNRPKFYNNPRLALFFQFQGFISTFTSTILPKIYGQLVGPGKVPAARAEAVRNILTLIMFGYMSTMLRDMIKTGEIPDEDDITNRMRRAVNASGILGTGERVVNRFFPLYPQRSDNFLDATGQFVAGESPAISWGTNVATAVGDMFDDTTSGREWQRVAKIMPGTGPFHGQFKQGETGPLRKAVESIENLFD